MKVSSEDLTALLDLLAGEYEGNYLEVERQLLRAIYSLHFVEDGDVPRGMIIDLSFILHQLSECFYQAHEKRRKRQKQQADKEEK